MTTGAGFGPLRVPSIFPAAAPSRMAGRSITIPLMAMVFLVSLATGIVAGNGLDRVNFAVKATVAICAAVLCTALVLYRPVAFPLSAYLFAIPFDNILQTGAGTITKFLAIATLGVLLLVMFDRRRTVTPSAAVLGWGGFLLWSVATLMWSRDVAFGMPALVQVIQLYVLFLVVAFLRIRPAELRVAAIAVVVGGVACSLYGVWMYLNGTGMASDGQAAQRLSITLSKGAFINADHFAAALVVPIALAFVGTLYARGWMKVPIALSLILLVAGIYVSATRGAFIAVGVIWLYLLIVCRQRLMLALLALGVLCVSIPMPSVWVRFMDPTQGEAGGRFGIWKIAFVSFMQHPWQGIGTGQFRLGYSDAYLQVPLTGPFHPWFEDSHNLIFSTAVEVGIIGLALMFTAWFLQFRATRFVPAISRLYPYRAAAEAGVLGLFFVALTVDLMWYKYLWLGFMLSVLVRNAWICERSSTDGVAT